ncbi:MAG TPA: S1/P1 nuclease [Tepidisphaeraceae bacterium]|nr:S1/P1 nuclease [Tepidisphaeraceae bacterium]
MGPVNIEFNRQCNAIIGGRGTGKSTILEYLRWGVCDQPPAIDDGEGTGDFQAKRKALVAKTLTALNAIVQVSFSVNGISHTVRRNSQSQELTLKIGSGEYTACSEDDVRSLLPVQAYSQKQLSNVGVRIEELDRLIRAPVRQRLAELEARMDRVASELRNLHISIQRSRSAQKQIDKEELEVQSLEQQAQGIRSKLTGFSPEDQKLIALQPLYQREGEYIQGLIAEDRLTPAAKSGINQLFGDDVNISDADVASWADDEKRAHRDQGPWHYVDIPAEEEKYDAKRDGRESANVIDKINDFAKVLADTGKPKEERADALKFIVHFVGDVHQPLHCAERHDDRGGNAVAVKFLDRKGKANLHMAWDSLILIGHKGKTRNAVYADELSAKITAERAAEWSKGTAEDWANESHAIAAKVIYPAAPPSTQPTTMTDEDIRKYGPIVDVQLQRGGVRLAAILNRLLK